MRNKFNIIVILLLSSKIYLLNAEPENNSNSHTKSFFIKTKNHLQDHWKGYLIGTASILAATRARALINRFGWVTRPQFSKAMSNIKQDFSQTQEKINQTYQEIIQTQHQLNTLKEETNKHATEIKNKIVKSENNVINQMGVYSDRHGKIIGQTKTDLNNRFSELAKLQQELISDSTLLTTQQIKESENKITKLLSQISEHQQELYKLQQRLYQPSQNTPYHSYYGPIKNMLG